MLGVERRLMRLEKIKGIWDKIVSREIRNL